MNNPSSLSDEQLIQYFLNGDPRAMQTLVELYKDRIYTSIYGLVQDREQAEAIFAEVFMKVIAGIIAGRSLEEGRFMPWAMQIAHGLCLQYNQKRRLFNSNEPAGASVNGVMTAGTITANHGKIRSLIDELPERQREVVVLNHYSGLSFKEIAELLKCSLTSTLETLHAALRNLGKRMEEKELCC